MLLVRRQDHGYRRRINPLEIHILVCPEGGVDFEVTKQAIA